MDYRPNRGGHAPGHLRDAFTDWVDADDYSKDTVVVGDAKLVKPIRWLLGQLWNCTDIMPVMLCEDLEVTQGSTYARAVRKLAQQLP
jgi:hypothetical protein